MRWVPALTWRLTGGLLLSLLFLGVSSAAAQSLGDLARQENQHRPQRPHCPTRVYTNEDFDRPQILDAQTRACLEAVRATAPVPFIDSPILATLDDTRLPPVPLGELARQLRAEREARAHGSLARVAAPAPRSSPSARPGRRFTAARVVRVERGDTLWKLAQQHLGSGFKWTELARLNPQIENPDRIYVGQAVYLPLERASSDTRQVEVQRGDSLWKVARAEFGNGRAWTCIAEANPQLRDASRIHPGQLLALPSTCREIP